MDEMLEFSQYSEMFKKLVAKTFTDPKTLPRISFDVALTSRPSITIYNEDFYIIWKFYGKRSAKRMRYLELETKSVTIRDSDFDSGAVKTLQFHVKGDEVIIGFHDSIEDVILFAKHLAKLFELSIRTLIIDAQHLDHLETILSIEKFKKAKEVTIQLGTVSHEKMRCVLEEFEPEGLSVFSSPDRGFTFDGTISVGHFHDAEEQESLPPSLQGQSSFSLQSNTKNDASWFKLPMLQNMRCREFSMVTQSIQNEDVNQFLRLWCNGTDGTNQMKIRITKYRNIHEYENEEETQCYQDCSLMDDENWDREKFVLQEIIHGLESFLFPNDDNSIRVLQRKTDEAMMSVEVSDAFHLATCRLKPYSKEFDSKAAMDRRMAEMEKAMHEFNEEDVEEVLAMLR